MKKIIILGSTGSIGTQTLSVVDKYPDKFKVTALACGSNYELLNQQIIKYKPKYVYIDTNRDKVQCGSAEMLDCINDIAAVEGDMVVSALVGFAGLAPTLTAISNGKDIALANKETLVAGGELVMAVAARNNSAILPVDSEHSALWQCSAYGKAHGIKKLILTASGGAFRGKSLEELNAVSLADALKHPTWKMGRKVTIDSATLMNKGLEIIEAMHLFGIGVDNIEVLVHKESIVHSMVMYEDNSILAELSLPSMVLPIQLALTYPDKIESSVGELNLADIATLNFERVDTQTFKCLELAYRVGRLGGTYGAILNAANEIAVNAFISNKIGFTDIPYCIEYSLDKSHSVDGYSYGDIVEADRQSREFAVQFVKQISVNR